MKKDFAPTKCAVCDTSDNYQILWQEIINNRSAFDFSARRIDKRHYRIVQCKKCNLVYSNPILTNEAILDLYRDSKFIMEDQIANQIKTYLDQLKKIDDLVPGKENLLEIGCANGYFLRAAKELGYKNVYGVEPSKDCLEKADPAVKDNIINDAFKEGIFAESFFDV
ncbi:class I SAM-dependent methyltransferase, partial [Candidatus Margulisiibacteriota bacterium]